MSFLPVSLDLAKGPVVLYGTGAAAHAKLHLLRDAGAKVKWFSPDIEADRPLLQAQDGSGDVDLIAGEPADDDLRGALALVCAASRVAATPLAARARALGVPVNVVDRLDLCTFIFPAMVNRDPVTIAIATGGAAPVLARRIR
jgi:uroporphyrin-III C-methyltransferase/precorrin-2 dehydrogenase/sirohydrochlorin ferrochelatase